MQQEEPLLLGLLDSKIREDVSWTINKVGGLPDSIHSFTIPCCKLCCHQLSLVCQLYCPLGGSLYHRVLYIFACTKRQCWNKSDSWTVLRSQLEDHCYGALPSPNKNSCNIKSGDHFAATNSTIGCNTGPDYTDLAAPALDEWGEDIDDWGDDSGAVATDTIAMVTAQFVDIKLESKAAQPIPHYNPISTDCLSMEVSSNNDIGSCNQAIPDDASLEERLDEKFEKTTEQVNVQAKSNSTVVEHDIFVDKKDNRLLLQENGAKNIEKDTTQLKIVTQTNKPDETVVNVTFESYYMNVTEAPENNQPTLKHEQKLLQEYTNREGVKLTDLMDEGVYPSSKGAERYEKAEVKHGDKVFHKFLKGVSPCPQQILRYQYNGSPLYISDPHALPKVPTCEYCGRERLFELQLMPSLVSQLRVNHDSGVSLEFGAVYIYTCVNSCWTTGHPVQNEYICIQPDPDSKLFKV